MMKGFEHMVVEVAIQGDRNVAIAAMDMNPRCPSAPIATIVVDELQYT